LNKRIAILDTSLFCCWLQVPGKETAGSGSNAWDFAKVQTLLEDEIRSNSLIVLPLATIIETGNHISQAARDRFAHAKKLCNHLRAAINSELPWVTFRDQASFWTDEGLSRLAADWPQLADAKMSFGDATIKHIADYYAAAGFSVRILTADRQLMTYQPTRPVSTPRRTR